MLTDEKREEIALEIMGFAVLDKEQAKTADMLICTTESAVRAEYEPVVRQMLDAMISLGGVGTVIAWDGQWEKINEAISAAKELLKEK